MTDVWWGLVEQQAHSYQWGGYVEKKIPLHAGFDVVDSAVGF